MENPNILIIILLVCVLPVLTMGFMAVVLFSLGRRELNRLVSPNAEVLFQQFQHMVTQNPREDKEVLIQKIINEQAFKCGVVGAIAGIGGFFTLPIALPIDVLLSIRLQSALAQFIASAYGHHEDRDTRVATYMVMTGSGQITQTGSAVIMRYVARRMIGKTLSKAIPFVGAFVGFAFNYFMARSTGWIAMNWYQHKDESSDPMIPTEDAV